MRHVIRVAGVMTAFGIVVAGCSHGDDTASSGATTTAKPPWDACSLSPQLLQQAGVDPASKQEGLGKPGNNLPNSTTCDWTGKEYAITLTASSTMTAQQVRTREGNHDFADVTVAGRPAFTLHTGVADLKEQCFLVIPFQSGGLAVIQLSPSGATLQTPACESAVRVGNVLASAMPR